MHIFMYAVRLRLFFGLWALLLYCYDTTRLRMAAAHACVELLMMSYSAPRACAPPPPAGWQYEVIASKFVLEIAIFVAATKSSKNEPTKNYDNVD